MCTTNTNYTSTGTTEYTKTEMENLATDIATKKKEYHDLITNLETNVNNIKNYWIEGDAEAEAVYTSFKDQFTKFKTELDNGYEMMCAFENRVLDQVEEYKTAETKARNAI